MIPGDYPRDPLLPGVVGVPFGHPDPAEGVSREERLAGENTRLRAALERAVNELSGWPSGERVDYARGILCAALSGGQA